MSGKISDLGVAKILNLTPAQITQRMSTQAPGTPCYMPPEALMARPTYTSKIDSYSYGVMVIHVLCGRWPFPDDAFRPDPRNPDVLVPVSELDRRAEYLRDIGQDHPLMGLISQCLSNAPTRRPEASEILRQITATASRVPERHQNKIEMLQHCEDRVQEKQSQIESLATQIQTLQSQNQTLESRIESLIARNQAEIESLRSKVERLSVRSQGREGVSGQAGQPQLQPGQQLQPHPPTPRLRKLRPAPPPPVPRPHPQPLPHMLSQVQYILVCWCLISALEPGIKAICVLIMGGIQFQGCKCTANENFFVGAVNCILHF